MENYRFSRKRFSMGIILMFVGTCIIPAIAQHTGTPLPPSRENWLYVGGGGPGNYTKIQDAIDAANTGDTVFVYSTSSPYYENVIINTSISLIGENRDTTIINGKGREDTIWIRASFVTMSGFTIVNSPIDSVSAGILVIEKKWWMPGDPPWLTTIHISDCILKNNNMGIRLYSTHATEVSSCIIHNNTSSSIDVVASSQITITNCDITHNGDIYIGGICISGDDEIGNDSENVTVSNCSISHNYPCGLWVMEYSRNIEVCQNEIFENTNLGIFVSQSNARIYNNHVYANGVGGFFDAGIFLQDCTKSVAVYDNRIETNNQYGLCLLRSSANSITKNNFIENTCNGYFFERSLLNRWNGNYWTDWIGLGPKLIKGKLDVVFIPWANFDWSPAQEPYDIEGGGHDPLL